MTDWNPAEILGVKPNPLSISIYKELITDNIWARSRAEHGYFDVGDTALMHIFLGTPYIDIRTDFNSFLPSGISNKIKSKLINYYLSSFSKNSEFLYDKVESSLLFSQVDFSTKQSINSLVFLDQSEKNKLFKELLIITNNSLKILKNNIKKYKKLDSHLNNIKKSKEGQINKIYNLITVGKIFGTLPFSNIARCAFISVNFLKSLVQEKIITKGEMRMFLNSLTSVTTDLLKKLSKSNRNDFIRDFGHVRPNTYDINSKSYAEDYQFFFLIVR